MSDEKEKHEKKVGTIDATIKEPNKEESNNKEELISRLNEAELEQKQSTKPVLIDCEFPNTAKLGEDYTIRYNKEFLKIEMEVYQGEKILKKEGNSNIVFDGSEKNKNEITYNFFNPNRLKGKVVNGLTPGKYLVKIHSYGYSARDEHNEEKIIEVS